MVGMNYPLWWVKKVNLPLSGNSTPAPLRRILLGCKYRSTTKNLHILHVITGGRGIVNVALIKTAWDLSFLEESQLFGRISLDSQFG